MYHRLVPGTADVPLLYVLGFRSRHVHLLEAVGFPRSSAQYSLRLSDIGLLCCLRHGVVLSSVGGVPYCGAGFSHCYSRSQFSECWLVGPPLVLLFSIVW